jgi:hypothetical protein
MKITKSFLKQIIKEELEKEAVEEGFFDMFRSKPKSPPPPEPEPEMVQMDMFPGEGYGKPMGDRTIAAAAFDVIASNMSTEQKRAKLSDLAKQVKGDGALQSRIMQAMMLVGPKGGDEQGSYDVQAAKAVALRENNKNKWRK